MLTQKTTGTRIMEEACNCLPTQQKMVKKEATKQTGKLDLKDGIVTTQKYKNQTADLHL
jgi:hypothetical protein